MYTLISMMNKAMIILNKYITKAYAACMYVCMYVYTHIQIRVFSKYQQLSPEQLYKPTDINTHSNFKCKHE